MIISLIMGLSIVELKPMAMTEKLDIIYKIFNILALVCRSPDLNVLATFYFWCGLVFVFQ